MTHTDGNDQATVTIGAGWEVATVAPYARYDTPDVVTMVAFGTWGAATSDRQPHPGVPTHAKVTAWDGRVALFPAASTPTTTAATALPTAARGTLTSATRTQTWRSTSRYRPRYAIAWLTSDRSPLALHCNATSYVTSLGAAFGHVSTNSSHTTVSNVGWRKTGDCTSDALRAVSPAALTAARRLRVGGDGSELLDSNALSTSAELPDAYTTARLCGKMDGGCESTQSGVAEHVAHCRAHGK